MKFIETENLNTEQKNQILKLWNQEYPKKLMFTNLAGFEEYLQKLADKHYIILSDEDGRVKGWLIDFIRDEERYFAIILDPSIQGQGWGSKFLDRAKKSNSELHGWVINQNTELKQNREPYRSPVGFYKKKGFQIRSEIITKKEGINGIKVTWKKSC